MKLAKETFVEKHTFQKEQRGHLIVTTEDESVFQQRLLFNNVTGFPLDFVVNHKDTLQGSGNAQSFGDNADDIMKSSLIALQLQFHAGHVYGNCCSNFHLVLFDFLREGCGLTQTTTCLQETSNYNICCQWTRTEECEAIRAEQQEQQPDNGARQKLLSRLQLHEQAKQQLMANHTNATTMNSVFLLSTK